MELTIIDEKKELNTKLATIKEHYDHGTEIVIIEEQNDRPLCMLPRDIKGLTHPKKSIEIACTDRDDQMLYLPPLKMAVSPQSGTVFVSDWKCNKLHLISEDGEVSEHTGTEAGGNSGELNRPSGIAVDSEGLVYVANTNNHCIEILREDGTSSGQIGKGKLHFPWALSIYQDLLYASSDMNDQGLARKCIMVYTLKGKYVMCFDVPGHFMDIACIGFSLDGLMYVFDHPLNGLHVFNSNGNYIKTFDYNPLLKESIPSDMLITDDSKIILADAAANRVIILSTDSQLKKFKVVHNVKHLKFIQSVAIDRQGHLLVLHWKVRRIDGYNEWAVVLSVF